MATTSQLDYMQCEMLVKVSDNSLIINSDVLENVQTLWKDDFPVVVLSVLGQPKSRKTSWMNIILNVFGEKFPVPRWLFPDGSDKDDPRYSDFQGQEGILVWKHPQRIQHFGGSATWLFLDIWQEYPRVEVYKQLVDFCLSVSTTVIFSECCDLQYAEYWNPNISTLCSGYDTIIDTMQLYFLIQTDDVPSNSFHPETPNITNCGVEIKDYTSDFSNKMTSIRRIAELFQRRHTNVTTSYVFTAYLREMSHLASFRTSNIGLIYRLESILQQCSLCTFTINQQVVRLPQIIGCFEKCIEAINQASRSTISSSYVQSLNQFQLVKPISVKQPSNIELPESTPQQYSYEGEDSEMKDIDGHSNAVTQNDENRNDEPIVNVGTQLSSSGELSPFLTNVVQVTGNKSVHHTTESGITEVVSEGNVDIRSKFNERYMRAFQKCFHDIEDDYVYFEESELLKSHISITNDIEAAIGTIDPIVIKECFNKVSEHNSAWKMYIADICEQVDKKTNLFVDKLCTRAKNNNINFPDWLFDNWFEKVFENLATGIQMHLHKNLKRIISSKKDVAFKDISKIYTIIDTYKRSFLKQFELKLCLTPQQFEDHHRENILAAKLSVNWEESTIESVNRLLDIITEKQKKVFYESNSRKYADEEFISKQAHEYALERFKFYLDKRISSSTLSENQFQKIYHDISTAVLSGFIKVLEHPSNELWLLQQRELKQKLHSLQIAYAQKNRSHLKKVDLAQKESMELGVQCYREEMKRNLPETKLSIESFNHLHSTCYRKSLGKFNENPNQIDKNIWKHCEDQLKNQLHELEKQFAEVNKNKPDQSRFHSETANSQNEQVKFEEHCPKVYSQPSKDPNPKQYGIGLYIDSHKVCVGVVGGYVNNDVEFSDNVKYYEPLIGFENGEVFVAEETISHDVSLYYNIFELLSVNSDNLSNVANYANISGKRCKLGQEEMLAIYFHYIRRNTERVIETSISSCAVAVTGLLTSGSKQLLKASLQLAGFQTNFLIPCTTAMAISYSLKFRNGDLTAGRKHNTLLVYNCSQTVEVSVAEISEANISTHKLCGDLNVYNRVSPPWTTLEKVLHRIFKNCAGPRAFDRFVICTSNTSRSLTGRIKTLFESILKEVRTTCTTFNNTLFELIKDVLRVAAVIDANSKRHPENALFRLPTYTIIHPYKLELKRKGKYQTFLDFNSYGIGKLNLELSFNEGHVSLEESARDAEKTWQVAKYKFTMPVTYHDRKISFLLNEDGNLVAETCPTYQPLYAHVTKSIILITLPNISNNIAPLLSKMDQKFVTQFPVDDQPKTTEELNSHTTSTGVTNFQEIEDLKKSLAILIAEVQQQLNNSSNTTDAVKENIRAKIRKCELMINESDPKLKQLQIEKNNLERASKLIKP